MTNITFRPGIRENVGLWISLIAGTGGGKTFTGMRLASGIADGKPFAVIDTENRRALHYADQFKFDHADLREPFSPDAYTDAIVAADKAGYPVILIDSGSHAWDGDGGVLDMHETELDERVARALKRPGESRADWQLREAYGQSAWIKPKAAHKHMRNRMLNVRAHLILCLRAEEKVEMVKNKDGKTEFVKKQSLTGRDGWIPICDKRLPFEATASFLLMADRPGVGIPIKLQAQHKGIFPDGQLIDEEAGRRLAEWAAGVKEVRTDAFFDQATNLEDLGKLWAKLSPMEKKNLSDAKDKAKERLTAAVSYSSGKAPTRPIEEGEPGENFGPGMIRNEEKPQRHPPADPMREALAFIRHGEFDLARTMKQYMNPKDQELVEFAIDERKGA